MLITYMAIGSKLIKQNMSGPVPVPYKHSLFTLFTYCEMKLGAPSVGL